MTPKQLSVLTRKELVEIARSHQVSGWHGMRKQQLVDAVSKIKSPKRKAQRSAAQLSGGRSPRIPAERRQPAINRPPRANRVRAGSSASMFRASQQKHDQVVSHAIDSEWLQVEWNFCSTTLDRAHAALGIDWHQSTPCIRLYDVTSDDQQMETKHRVYEVAISGRTKRWYVPVPLSDRDYKVQIGLLAPNNRFFLLSQSRKIRVPAGTVQAPSKPQHNGWPSAVHTNQNEPKLQQLRPLRSRISASVCEPSEVQNHSGSPFTLDAELTIRGTVAEGSQLTILDERVQLARDGSFAIRVRIPDGRQVLPAVALSPDGTEKRTILLAVERNTKELEPEVHNRYSD
ncbi:MAG: DUF4912 domain-containing protein [Planctomycetaceae bacterium]